MQGKILLLVLTIILISKISFISCQDQHIYKINDKKSWLTLGAGTSIFLTGAYLTLQNEPLSVSKISNLNHQDLPAFDHSAVHRNSSTSNNFSNYLQVGSLLFPASLMLNRKIRSDYASISIMTSELLLINTGLNMLAKNIISRTRPFVYNSEVSIETKTTRNAKLSFYSGHVANTAALSFFTAQILTDYTDNKTVKIISWTSAAVLSAIMGYLRYDAGKHFLSDIVVGYVAGGLLGYFIPVWHRNESSNSRVEIEPMGAGVRLTYHIR